MKKISGFLFIVSALFGLFLASSGIISTWVYRPQIIKSIDTNLDLANQVLDSTDGMLASVSQVLQSTTVDMSTLQATIDTFQSALEGVNPMLETVVHLTEEDLPNILDNTEAAISSVQNSAVEIDNVLYALTSLPYSPIKPYAPTVPLHTSLSNVYASLEQLRPTTEKLNESVATGKTSLAEVGYQLNTIADTVQGINSSLQTTAADIQQYSATMDQLKTNLETIRVKAPMWITVIDGMITFSLLWVLTVSAGMAVQGITLILK